LKPKLIELKNPRQAKQDQVEELNQAYHSFSRSGSVKDLKPNRKVNTDTAPRKTKQRSGSWRILGEDLKDNEVRKELLNIIPNSSTFDGGFETGGFRVTLHNGLTSDGSG